MKQMSKGKERVEEVPDGASDHVTLLLGLILQSWTAEAGLVSISYEGHTSCLHGRLYTELLGLFMLLPSSTSHTLSDGSVDFLDRVSSSEISPLAIRPFLFHSDDLPPTGVPGLAGESRPVSPFRPPELFRVIADNGSPFDMSSSSPSSSQSASSFLERERGLIKSGSIVTVGLKKSLAVCRRVLLRSKAKSSCDRYSSDRIPTLLGIEI